MRRRILRPLPLIMRTGKHLSILDNHRANGDLANRSPLTSHLKGFMHPELIGHTYSWQVTTHHIQAA